MKTFRFVLAALFALNIAPAQANAAPEQLNVAVAANFVGALRRLAPLYEEVTGTRLIISSGATGALYTQIRNGAPFDVFLSADADRPRALAEEDGLADPATRVTYAKGRLVLWSAKAEVVDGTAAVLQDGSFRRLAIANPRTAPYGAAAIQVLEGLALHRTLRERLVTGENIGQAYQWVRAGTADIGFVALAQVVDGAGRIPGSYWIVPEDVYEPILQQAVVLVSGQRVEAAREFVQWLGSARAVEIIQAAGYGTPDEP